MDAKKYLAEILTRGIEFYDYKKLDGQAQADYFNEANRIVTSEVFTNELTHYMADLVKFAATESNNWDQVMHARSAIIALETLKQRLESIEDPKINKTKEDEYSAI